MTTSRSVVLDLEPLVPLANAGRCKHSVASCLGVVLSRGICYGKGCMSSLIVARYRMRYAYPDFVRYRSLTPARGVAKTQTKATARSTARSTAMARSTAKARAVTLVICHYREVSWVLI
jgi:hypothetical protein